MSRDVRLTFNTSDNLLDLEDCKTSNIGWNASIKALEDEYSAAVVSMSRREVERRSDFDCSLSEDSRVARSGTSAGTLALVIYRPVAEEGATRSGKCVDA